MIRSTFKFIPNVRNVEILRRIIIIGKVNYTFQRDAGHSKWANIRHIKGEKDGQRAATFTKLSRQIRLAIQEGGSTNPTVNSSLKNAIEMALSKNMPMNSIQNTIKKCEQNKSQMKKHILEIKAFQKVFFVCVLYTDNLVMLKMNLSPIVKKASGSFVDARHLFDDSGIIEATVSEQKIQQNDKNSPEKLEEICTEDAIECGAEEVEIIDPDKGIINFFVNPIQMQRVINELVLKGYKIESAEHVFIPKTYVDITSNDVENVNTFINKLKAVEGVEEIYDNINPNIN